MCARKVSGPFDLELPPTIETIASRIERLAGRPIETTKVKSSSLGPCVGYFADDGTPRIEAVGKPELADLALELLRLHLRRGTVERDMPYAEMQFETNRMLCTRLFRILEEEVLLPEASGHGVAARTRLAERFEQELLEPLRGGKYGKGTKEPLRTRLGALDALEFAVAAVDRPTARARLREVAELDEAIGRTAAFMYAVMDRYRPFDSWDRITGGYYVVVPFLFESRNHAG